MLKSMQLAVTERLRCAKHNLLDGMDFKISYSGGLYTVSMSDIDMKFKHNPFLAFHEIMCGYLRNGEWDLKPGDYVVDAGAYLGEFGLFASLKVGPTGKVFLFEPDPNNVEKIKETFALNGGLSENVEILTKGLWENQGTLWFQANQAQSSKIVKNVDIDPGANPNLISIEVESIDSLSEARDLPRLDFIKMDIEGAEIQAVRGAVNSMKRLKPRFSIASYHLLDGKQTYLELEEMFRRSDYEAKTEFPSHKTTVAYAR